MLCLRAANGLKKMTLTRDKQVASCLGNRLCLGEILAAAANRTPVTPLPLCAFRPFPHFPPSLPQFPRCFATGVLTGQVVAYAEQAAAGVRVVGVSHATLL